MCRVSFGLIVLAALSGCGHGRAQFAAPAAPVAVDPPDRVARISYMSGPVSFKAAGTESWVAAELNRPLTVGDELWTDENARAELDLGHAFVRLNAKTSLAVLNLNDRRVQLSLPEGTAQVRLRRLDEEDEFEVSTPQAAFTLLRTGDYRLRADDGRSASAIVRSGQIEAVTPSQSVSVRAQQAARFEEAATPAYQVNPSPPLDAFDDFCRTRDQRAEVESAKYVSPYVIGREDLDEHGSWRVDVTYGPVWYPRVVGPGWSPYRFGHWVWIEPWGWTWIDDAPWGFAPFHYGRWVFIRGGWGWVPGPVRVRAVYAPALVVFAGGGPGLRYYFRIGAGLGVAWFPLGPREIYIPPYRASRIYVTNINVSHTIVTNRTNIWNTDVSRQRYINRDVAGALTAVPEDVFARGRPVASASVNVSAQQARAVRIGGSAPPVMPRRESIAPGDGRVMPQPPDGITRRQATVRQAPAPAPVPFERSQSARERDPGRPPVPGNIPEVPPARPEPSYRRAQPTPPAQASPAQAPARPSTAPRRVDPPRTESPRATENRRRTIEQERQRNETPPSRPEQGQPSRSRRKE